jgi:hypothetical protein
MSFQEAVEALRPEGDISRYVVVGCSTTDLKQGQGIGFVVE